MSTIQDPIVVCVMLEKGTRMLVRRDIPEKNVRVATVLADGEYEYSNVIGGVAVDGSMRGMIFKVEGAGVSGIEILKGWEVARRSFVWLARDPRSQEIALVAGMRLNGIDVTGDELFIKAITQSCEGVGVHDCET